MSNRNRVFPPYYAGRHEASPARVWLMDFDAWLARQAYNRTSHRTHLSVAATSWSSIRQ